ncbi:hypothetical protein CFC21_104715 [Triticum aestivum]|uniref:ubiquinol oxidase (non-electrogenic) n=2 Tax=Triticum aestivum TaxID=4565 RepID=A0A3B6SS31_WHEAT|nr:hypothetical protein CFC21_104715 [Triticum aestivum]
MVRRRRWRSTATRGIEQSKKLVREEDTEWKWSCFRPWETYTADMSIDLTKHHVPNTMLDKIAYYTVKSLRFPTDIFFQVRALPGLAPLLHARVQASRGREQASSTPTR